MPLLIEFVYRLAFGLALSMAVTSSARVTSGYFRNHLYVLLGLNVLATLAAIADPERFLLWPPLAAAIASYVGSVAWLYETPRLGVVALLVVAGLDLAGSWLSPTAAQSAPVSEAMLALLDPVSGGLLVGSTMAAMFLGHWYLNTPTMELAPLRRLLRLMACALALRVAVSSAGLIAVASYDELASINLALLSLRWIAGLLAMAAVIWMIWQTLKIPNRASWLRCYCRTPAAFRYDKAMNVTFACPRCENPSRAELESAADALSCPNCETSIAIPPGAIGRENLERCLICPSRDLYLRKDFPQRLGVLIVVLGFAASTVTWAYSRPIWTFAILFATALVDVVLYLVMPSALVCYHCGAQYRNLPTGAGYPGFELEIHERYRQQAIRKGQRERTAQAATSSVNASAGGMHAVGSEQTTAADRVQ
jgi:hypothetical protein